MRQQIRLVISPAQISALITDLDKSPALQPGSIAFLKYLKTKQLSLTLGLTALAYEAKGDNSHSTKASPDIINNSNVMTHCNMIINKETELSSYTPEDQKQLQAFAAIMGMNLSPSI